jgi:hypothetical protein
LYYYYYNNLNKLTKMPRRLPVRPAKVFGNFFVLVVLAIMALIYYTYTFVVWGPRAQ